MDYSLVPEELRALPQWVGATVDKLPINPITGATASVTDSATWGSFDQAINCGQPHIGLVFTKDDPYIFIDLDTGKTDDVNVKNLHVALVKAAGSYTETSMSGTGSHIVVKGVLDRGFRDDASRIEVYPSERYMLVTGDCYYSPNHITTEQDFIDYLKGLVASKRPVTANALETIHSDDDDAVIWERAATADNGIKFQDLWKGNWELYREYDGDHSKADLGLLTILDFYTKDVDQVIRLFKMSGLYRPEKGRSSGDGSDYIIRSLKYARARNEADQPPPVDTSALIVNATQVTPPQPPTATPSSLEYPPGLVGRIAYYLCSSAVRPVPEIAIAGAIAFVSGIVGRQYNISNTGLNQYLVLLAKTGTGKESIAGGIDRIMDKVRQQVPAADCFLGPAAFSSGPAIIKTLAETPSFMSILGEFGLTFQRINHPRANGADQTYRQILLSLYNKSGWTDMLGASRYSDKEKNTQIIQAPSFTFLGESTPETFYTALSEHTIADGLAPRFTIIEYTGKQPYVNDEAFYPPPADLINEISTLCATVLQMTANNANYPLPMSAEADSMGKELGRYYTDIVNAKDAHVHAELWNRAHIKILKLAGLLAVGESPSQPVVQKHHLEYAKNFVECGIRNILTKFEGGDIGEGDSKQVADLRRTIENYLNKKPSPYLKKLHAAKVIPYKILQQRTANLAAFRGDRKGATFALNTALGVLLDSGDLVEVPKQQMKDTFGNAQKAFGVGHNWSSDK